MIIVEGCDGTGKTTLVKQLARDLNLPIGVRATKNRDELYKVTRQDTYVALGQAVQAGAPATLWDRLGPISDPIYSRMAHRDCAFTLHERARILGIMQLLEIPVVVCDLPLYNARKNAEAESQIEGVNENFTFIHGQYRELLRKTAYPYLYTYNYNIHEGYETLRDRLTQYLAKRKEREWRRFS